MGEVWRASHRFLARHAAVKLIRHAPGDEAAPGASDGHARRRFEREAQVIARLRSPHTVDIFDFGVADDGTFYYVMELLDGFDLQALVERFGPVPLERAVHLLTQVCHSLSEAHSQALIHRDVKPANIYACRYGRDVDFVKVLDFGLVKPAVRDDGPTALAITGTHAARGTPAFMSPEQALGDRPLDERSDIYAIGCLGYWLVTGELVFPGRTPMETIAKHVQAEPEPPSRHSELGIPDEFDALMLACLAKSPDHRPPTADAIAARLASIALPTPWSQARARQWWALYHPAPGTS